MAHVHCGCSGYPSRKLRFRTDTQIGDNLYVLVARRRKVVGYMEYCSCGCGEYEVYCLNCGASYGLDKVVAQSAPWLRVPKPRA